MNKIQDIFNDVSSASFALELPQVAVVGSQSSGKSSVLEALVGRDFLPRGPDICTRRPLILQLVKMSNKAGVSAGEWGEFLHAPGKRFYDFERIRTEILAETDRVVGSNKGISEKPIRLKICSPNVLTMTLVDLPGITRVPVGDQPADIEEQIRKMVVDYIRMESCLILAVTAANSDLSNSDSLQLARQVDPEGNRTIGVVTKLDIMDRGTDASDILRNKVVPLRLGYIGVVNRSQHDINTSKTMQFAREAEKEFFGSHPEYAPVLNQCGTHVLAKTLNAILVQHIQTLLPSLRHALEVQLNQRAAELASYGEPAISSSTASQGALLLRLVSEYADAFGQMVNGNYQALPVHTVAGGARIRYIFKDIFMKGLDQLSPSHELSDEDIRTTIKNSGGVKGSLLIPEEPFELLTRRALAKLQSPALQCYEFVFEELVRMAEQCMPRDFARFPILERRAREAAQDFIVQGCPQTEQMILNLLSIETSYINTDHPQFIGGSNAVAHVIQQRKERPLGTSSSDDGGGSTAHMPRTSNSAASAPSLAQAASSSSPAVVVLRGGRHEHSNSTGVLGLKAVEPELFSGATGADKAWGPDPAAANGSTRWFSGLFGMSRSDRGGSVLSDPPQVLQAGKSDTEQDHVEVEVTRLLVQSYFDIVRRNLQDSVPKAVMHFLVVHAQKGLQQHLIRELYKEELFQEMMCEREDISSRRAHCIEQLSAVRRSLTALDDLPRALIAVARESRSPSSVLSSINGAPYTMSGVRASKQGALASSTSLAALMASAALPLE